MIHSTGEKIDTEWGNKIRFLLKDKVTRLSSFISVGNRIMQCRACQLPLVEERKKGSWYRFTFSAKNVL